MKILFRWKLGSVQSKAISLLTFAAIIFPLLAPTYTYATDYPPSVPNATVFSGQTEAPKVDEPTGAFTQRVSLDIPPGRDGLQPDLSLNYNSQDTEDGIVGYGWSLSIPYIERLNKAGSQDLYNDDVYFTSSMDAELAVASAVSKDNYRARIDNGPSRAYHYASSSNTWTMYDNNGTKYTYGSDDTGRMYDTTTGTSAKTYRWMLQEVRDTNVNYITYTYSRDNNVLYPDAITYSSHDSTDGRFSVDFTTDDRLDVRVSYGTGFFSTTTKRVSEIDASVNGSVVRKYLLDYGVGDNGYRSLLTGVYQQGYDEGGNLTTLPGTTFAYATSSTQFYAPAVVQIANSTYVVSDVNGNGINDTSQFPDSGSSGSVYYDNASDATSVTIPAGWTYTGGYPNETGVRFIDVNGDGRADVIKGVQTNPGPVITHELYINASGSSWTASTTYDGSIPNFAVLGPGSAQTTGIFGNFNGDGLPDFSQNISGQVGAYLGNGSTWDSTTTVFAAAKPFPNSGSGPTETASELVDLNGDGLDDWVYSHGSNTYVLLNNGTGWNSSPSPQWTIATSTLYHNTSYYDRGIRFMDINGDGLPDFVRSYTHTNGDGCTGPEVATVKALYLNTGNGWATSTAYDLSHAITFCGGSGSLAHNEYANFTGNGQQYQDVLSTVKYSKGGSAHVIYKSSVGTNPTMPYPPLVVGAVGKDDGMGNSATTTYSYEGGKLYLASGVRDRKFAGFSVATTTAPDSVTGTYYSQGDSLNAAYGEQSDGYAQIGHPFRKDVFDRSGN